MGASPIVPRSPGNAQQSLSANGRRQLIFREGLIRHYYNDAAHNCTYGVGTLAHLGPCTAQELVTPVSNEQLETSLENRIDHVEKTVRERVNRQDLTQLQFDALVSFTYNVGAGRARDVLSIVNSGRLNEASVAISQYTHATVRGANGQPERDENGRVITRVLPGLVTRRQEESAPFRVNRANVLNQ